MIVLKRGLAVPGSSPSDRSQTGMQGSVLRSRAPAFGALTIDVEDYFQVEAFAKVIDRQDWECQQPRVSHNTNRLLDILAEANVSATFFTLGWTASRNPELVRRIAAEGHELASHGSDHRRVDRQSPDEFRSDVRRSKAVLEGISGTQVVGFRAPTFSAGRRTPWFHDILAEEGFQYSSSVYPVAHDLYGEPTAPRQPFCPIPGFIEIPLTTVRVLGRNFQAAGGGYFRLLPYRMTRKLLRKAHADLRTPCIFYIHPWEIDPDQPKQFHAPLLARFRHYLNLHRTEKRLLRLLYDFRWGRMDQLFIGEATGPLPLINAWTK
jgi:polysaccharide deacetylase family protein (PEP-CTERM system associated)